MPVEAPEAVHSRAGTFCPCGQCRCRVGPGCCLLVHVEGAQAWLCLPCVAPNPQVPTQAWINNLAYVALLLTKVERDRH